MTKSSFLSILRFVLTAVGAYVAGKFFLGSPIDNNIWLGIAGSIVSAASIVWGIVDKTASVEMLQSSLTSIITFFGTLLVGAGYIKDEIVQAILGIISIVVPMIYSQANKQKNIAVATGKLGVADLSGVQGVINKNEEAIAPVVNTPLK